MAARVNYSVATLSAAASGRRLPTLEVTLAYVAARDGDRAEWERRWREAESLSVGQADDPAPAATGQASPYLGLATFQPGDAASFFGRAALVDELVCRLRERRFLAVFGPSGAGKSSVVRAGLVPAVDWPAVVITPGVHPMAELAVLLARHAGVPAGGLLDELREDPVRASLMVRQGLPAAPEHGDLLVVVDQFEEVFASCPDPAERADFVAALVAMCREPDGRARVVLAVRADHYARFTEHPQLLAALADAQVLIGGMSPTELREAVTRPAEARGARVEGALVATIVAEVADSPGALPLAALAFREANRANDERDRALSYQLVANARDQLQVDQELAVLLARAAYDTRPTAEAAAVLRQSVIDSRIRVRLVSGQQQVFGVAYSPDGRRVASSGADGTVRVWTMPDSNRFAGNPRVLRGHGGEVSAVAFSPDGVHLAAGGGDGPVMVWSLAVTAPPAVLRGHEDTVWSVAFRPDGRQIVSAGHDSSERVWDTATGAELVALRGHGAFVEQAQFGPDDTLVTANGDGTIRLTRCEACQPIDHVRAIADANVTRRLSADERHIYLHK